MIMFKTQKQIVTAIHNEFDSAQDRLLKEAREIIESHSPVDEKADRLIKQGFTGSELAVKKIKSQQLVSGGIEQANIIEYYKQHYPFQKFITEPELDRICKKYNLIYAPVANYKNDVPEKNLSDIENISELHNEDYPEDEVFTLLKYHYIFDIVGMSWFTAKTLGLPRKIKNERFDFWSRADDYLRRKYSLTRSYIVKRSTVIEINKQGLFIAAPKSHFDLTGLTKEGLLNSTFTITVSKDPIVFRFVRGGVQIITKWGLEGKDEVLTNEKMN